MTEPVPPEGPQRLEAADQQVVVRAVVPPFLALAAVDVPKPHDWQMFQRLCVPLFRAELKDPHASQYGRQGQAQHGIDILGCRNGDANWRVGIQCRRLDDPISEGAIYSDSLKAVRHFERLKEIIFVTTADNDAAMTDAADRVQRQLNADGYSVRVIVYGWQQLQELVASHKEVAPVWHPGAVTILETVTSPGQAAGRNLSRMSVTPEAPSSDLEKAEDPALHAKIDMLRDLAAEDQAAMAFRKLKELLVGLDREAKPWAFFRINANIAAAALDIGNEAVAAEFFEISYNAFPNDPRAKVNLALAQLIRRHAESAMSLCREALEADPPAINGVGCILQAAARSTWQGEPIDLIPESLRDTEQAAFGLAEFIRIRAEKGWERKVLDICEGFPSSRLLRRIRALAILSLASEGNVYLPGGVVTVSPSEISWAANEMKRSVIAMFEGEFAANDIMAAMVNNAGVLLLFDRRPAEAEAILRRGIEKIPNDNVLLRLLAIVLGDQDRHDEALEVLRRVGADADANLLAAEFMAEKQPAAALKIVGSIDPAALSPLALRSYGMTLGMLAVTARDREVLEQAKDRLAAAGEPPVAGQLLEVAWSVETGAAQDKIVGSLLDIVTTIPDDAAIGHRYMLASRLRDADMFLEASRILEGRVNLQRPSPVSSLYFQALANSRRDQKFLDELAAAGDLLREDPPIQWMRAAHAFKTGDLPACLEAVETVIGHNPDFFFARVMKIEALLRAGKDDAVRTELANRLEDIPDVPPSGTAKLAMLLNGHGYSERAAALSYRQYLLNRDASEVWQALINVMLGADRVEGRGARWVIELAGIDAAVDVELEDKVARFFIIEADPSLRRIDDDAREPGHELAVAVSGKRKGDEFELPDGRRGVIRDVRHKYVARMQQAMLGHEERFPDSEALHSVSVDAHSPDGLNDLFGQLKQNDDYIKEQVSKYDREKFSIRMLAFYIGKNTIEAAGAIHGKGGSIFVELGNELERQTAFDWIERGIGHGCVLDLRSFWDAWQLTALDLLVNMFGSVALSQSTVDELCAFHERMTSRGKAEQKFIGYRDNKPTIITVSSDAIDKVNQDFEAAIQWIRSHAEIVPVIADDGLPDNAREGLVKSVINVLDEVIISRRSLRLLITDDTPCRQWATYLGGRSAWLYAVFLAAYGQRRIDLTTFTRWTAYLVGVGQVSIGVTGELFAEALKLGQAGHGPQSAFSTLAGAVGGPAADIRSHVGVVSKALYDIWTGTFSRPKRQAATNLLIRRLVADRPNEARAILKALHDIASGTARVTPPGPDQHALKLLVGYIKQRAKIFLRRAR